MQPNQARHCAGFFVFIEKNRYWVTGGGFFMGVGMGHSVANEHGIEQAVIAVSSKTTVGGTVIVAASDTAQRVSQDVDVLMLSDCGIYIGMAVAVLGFLINAVAHYRRDKRERDLHKAEMRRLESDCEYD